MARPAAFSFRLAAAALVLSAANPAHALIKFNDGRDEIFVTATAGIAYDSNLFATQEGDGDTSLNASLLLEYRRKAGMLGVNGSVGWTFSKFSNYSEEDFANPRFAVELTKDSGRTTGSIRAGAQKENRAETAINLRTESWNYTSGATVRYPVIERYSLVGTLDYDQRDFSENLFLVDINTYSAGADLLYALNSERDLVAGYRYRITNTTADNTDRDHAMTTGVEGKIIPKLYGSARLGVQRRSIEKETGPDSSHSSLTGSLSTTWTLTSRFSLLGSVEKDFNTLATDESIDSTIASLTAQYAVNAKTSAFASLSYGDVRFVEPLTGKRRDNYVGLNIGASYSYTERLRFTLACGYFENWSTVPTSDFERNTVSFNVSSRW